MPKQDFSNYEQRLSVDHERACRTVITVSGRWMICPIRACRRDKTCTGPMRISPHQERKVRMQREIGLSGHACARLPVCMATQRDAVFREFERNMESLQKFLVANPEQTLPRFTPRIPRHDRGPLHE